VHDQFDDGFRPAIAGPGLRWPWMVASLYCLLSLIFALPTSAQHPDSTVVIHGLVQDAVSAEPVGDAIVAAGDSATVVRTDPDGVFAVLLSRDGPYVVSAEAFGYARSVFELPEDAASKLVVLVLEPAPIEIAGVDVVGESAITELVGALERRRRSYAGRVVSFDRDQLAAVPAQTALGLVLLRAPGVSQCSAFGGDPEGLCRRLRRSSIRTSFRGDQGPSYASILLCVDGMPAGSSQLAAVPMEQIVLFESYGRRMADGADGTLASDQGSVRIYTREWFTSPRARRSANTPVRWGC
jgi:hypothetical protein